MVVVAVIFMVVVIVNFNVLIVIVSPRDAFVVFYAIAIAIAALV